MEKINFITLDIKFIFIWIILIGIWVFFWYVIWKISKYSDIKNYRNDAIKRSKSAILWEVYEKIMPFLTEFEYSPKDMVFIWKWFDYLIMDWLSEWDLKEIIFMEIKYWSSQLNKNEKMIRQIVGSKKIKYVEYRIPKS